MEVGGIWFAQYFGADLVKGFGDSLVLRAGRVLLSTLHLVDCNVHAFRSHENLRQITGHLIALGPLKVTWPECGLLTLRRRDGVTIFIFGNLNFLLLLKLFVLDFFSVNNFILEFELKADDGFDRPDVLLDVQELVHAPGFKPVVFILQFGVVAKTLKEHVLLVGHL